MEATIEGKRISECPPAKVDYYRRLIQARKQECLHKMGGVASVVLVVKAVQIGAQA